VISVIGASRTATKQTPGRVVSVYVTSSAVWMGLQILKELPVATNLLLCLFLPFSLSLFLFSSSIRLLNEHLAKPNRTGIQELLLGAIRSQFRWPDICRTCFMNICCSVIFPIFLFYSLPLAHTSSCLCSASIMCLSSWPHVGPIILNVVFVSV
jgi:hypothetical protein